MADYSPTLVYEYEVRNFFTPAIDYEDVSKAEMLSKIEAVEDFIKAVYFQDSAPTRSKAKIPALLLVCSKIIQNPKISKKYHVVRSETLGDYKYELWSPTKSSKTSMDIALSWEEMALRMLKKRVSDSTHGWQKIKVVND